MHRACKNKIMKDSLDANFMEVLSNVALGEKPPDLMLKNASVLNVYTGEILNNFNILISGDRIAYVGPDHDFPRGKNPLLTLFTITFTAIPSIRLLSRGYWLARENKLAGVFV